MSRNPEGVDELVREYQNSGRTRALDDLLRVYAASIAGNARRWARSWNLDVDDCQQLASLGFCRAVKTYDPSTSSLLGYALQWMRAFVQRSRAERGPIRYSVGSFTDALLVSRVCADLERKGKPTTADSIGAACSLSKARIERALSITKHRHVSTDMSVGRADGRTLTLSDLLPAPPEDQPQRIAEQRGAIMAARTALMRALPSLEPRERAVLKWRLLDELTLDEAGKKLGLSREMARLLQVRGTAKLRKRLSHDPRVRELLESN